MMNKLIAVYAVTLHSLDVALWRLPWGGNRWGLLNWIDRQEQAIGLAQLRRERDAAAYARRKSNAPPPGYWATFDPPDNETFIARLIRKRVAAAYWRRNPRKEMLNMTQIMERIAIERLKMNESLAEGEALAKLHAHISALDKAP